MKKNGFIATSILYSFFLVFITLFIGLILNYIHNQALLVKLNEASWEMLMEINNTKISDLEVGDFIKLKNKVGEDNVYLNDDASWVVSHVREETDGTLTYYLLSDLDAQLLDVNYKLETDRISKMHSMTIDIHNALVNGQAYTNSLAYPNIKVTLPMASVLSEIRKQNYDDMIMNNIYNVNGSYIVYIDEAIDGYAQGNYYEMRTYNFNLKDAQEQYISSYCGGLFDGSKVNYEETNYNNSFGYIHVMHETVKNAKYVSYCTFASPVAYEHKAQDKIVIFDESRMDDMVTTTYSSTYTLRLMASINVDKNSNNSYIAGGKGTSLDPYILTNGVKQS